MSLPPIPVTVLTGFLGSGKTTLLNRILTEKHGLKIAVIENEFGEIGIDNDLVIQSEEEVFEMNNGCVCCTVRGDLLRILGRLLRRKKPLDAILIETTGLADPGPVTQTFFADQELKERFLLDAIVTLVDAKHVSEHLDKDQECQKQIAFADIILLNKTDLLPDAAALDALEGRLRAMNGVAKIFRTQNAGVDIKEILGVRAFDITRKLELDPELLNETASHIHNEAVGSVGLRIKEPLAMDKLQKWMGPLLKLKGPDIYRMKGILNIAGEPRRIVFQGVHMTFDARPDRPWSAEDTKESRMVFIGRDLDRADLRQGFEACRA